MKTRYIAIILGIIISGSVIFAIFFEFPSQKEHYEINITGLKDVYLVGEPYSFSYAISGYGYACANREITYPNANGDSVRNNIDVDCNAGAPKTEFVIDSKDESTKSIAIKNPGRYVVSIMFERSTGFEPTQSSKEFHVVEKICDSINLKDKVHCFDNASKSCTSSYIKTNFSTVEGDPIYIIGIVESWNDCTLRVFLDTTQDSYGGHSTGILRSVCEDVIMKEDYWTISNCNNFDVPPKLDYGI